jgi:hypothetical protein
MPTPLLTCFHTRDPAHYTFAPSGTCSTINGRYFCSQWCDETFPMDSYGNNLCDRAVERAHLLFG